MNTHAINRSVWADKSIFEQMGNIASEVGRALKAKRNSGTDNAMQATTRTVDLFDATVDELQKRNSARLKEVLRAKEEFLRVMHDTEIDTEDIEKLEQYFMQFAVAARLHR